jgi:hypothetical protein
MLISFNSFSIWLRKKVKGWAFLDQGYSEHLTFYAAPHIFLYQG